MLKIENLEVKLKSGDKRILDGLCLEINDGEVHAIMGPNGTGKSTLAKTLMSHYLYEITSGKIYFNDEDITKLDTCAKARKGIFLAMQDPTSINGVMCSEFLKTARQEITGEHIDYFDFIKKTNEALKDLSFPKDMVHRHLNVGFSGGEKKKNEILQIKILEPKFIILDEIDSGLDVDSLKIVCENINKYKMAYPETSILIITHYPRILEYIKPDYVHIMNHGKIVKTGDFELALKVEQEGYNE